MRSATQIRLDEWMSLDEAADRLGITRQAVGRAVMRHGIPRRAFANVIVVDRSAVERYARERKPTGPRRQGS